jgi:cytochrome P450 family 4
VTVSHYSIHRSEKYFSNPDQFNPDRWLTEKEGFVYIPFGTGKRKCIGKGFSLLQQKVIISTLLREFRIEFVNPNDKVQIDSRKFLLFSPIDAPIRFVRINQ